jgi:hypothetical protein
LDSIKDAYKKRGNEIITIEGIRAIFEQTESSGVSDTVNPDKVPVNPAVCGFTDENEADNPQRREEKSKEEKSKYTGVSDETPELKTAVDLATLLLKTHREEFPDYLSGKDKSVIPKWARDIEKLIRLDKKEPETIRRVILWVKTPGNFWFHNIESGGKLRKQFERLYGQMSEKTSTGPPKHRIANDNVDEDDIDQYFTEA